MTQLLDFSTSTGLSRVLAAPFPIAQFDGVEEDISGQAYTIQGTDTAAKNAVGALIAETVLDAGNLTVSTSQRLAQIQHPVSKDMYQVAPISGGAVGLTIYRYNTAGILLGSALIDTISPAATNTDAVIGWLSNGNLFAYSGLTNNCTRFTIFDKNLNVVVATTTVTGVPNANGYWDAFPLVGGGFAITYVDNANNQRYGIFNNDGTVNLAQATLVTWTGASNSVVSRVRQLSNSNLVFGFTSKYATTVGLYYAVLTLAGATVVALTQFASGTPSGWLELAVVGAFFALAYHTTTTTVIKIAVFNNAGVQQGTTLSRTNTGTPANTPIIKLLADTVNTQFIYIDSLSTSATATNILSISTAGVSTVLTTGITVVSGGGGNSVDAFIDRNRVVLTNNVGLSATTVFSYAVFNLATGKIDKNSTTFGSTQTSGNAGQSIMAIGDFCFAALYAQTTTTQQCFTAIKYAASSIIGAAFTTILANAVGYVRSGAGTFNINQIGGQPGITFDHSAATPHGNKGSISSFSLNLSGI